MAFSRCRNQDHPVSCEDAAGAIVGAFPDCDDSDSQRNTCYHCRHPLAPPDDPCEFQGLDYGRCDPFGAAPPFNVLHARPYFCVIMTGATRDAFGNSGPFFARAGREGTYQYYFQSDLTFDLDLCQGDTGYCSPPSPVDAKLLCRVFVHNAADRGWVMRCMDVEIGEPSAPPDQLVPKSLFLAVQPAGPFQYDNARTAHVVLATGHSPSCFGPLSTRFCLTATCDPNVWSCVDAARARAVDWLYLFMDLWFSDDNVAFPHANPHEIILKNAVLACACYALTNEDGDALIDRIDAPGHIAGSAYDSKDKGRWSHSETFGGPNTGFPANPVVQGVAASEDHPNGWYAEYVDQPIPITCVSLLTQAEFPAVLTLRRCWMVLDLDPETQENSGTILGQVVHGDFLLRLELRVQLLAAAYDVQYPFAFFGAPGEPDPPFAFEHDTGQLSPIGFRESRRFTISGPPRAIGDVELTFEAMAEFAGVDRYAEVWINGGRRFNLWDTPANPGGSCVSSTYVHNFSAEQWNDIVGGGDAAIMMTCTPGVRPDECSGSSWISVRVRYLAQAVPAGDPFDLRVKDPANPGEEHPWERVTAHGPNGERVPRWVNWRGLRTTQQFSRGPNIPVLYDSVGPCCDVLRAINGTVISGETTDNSALQGGDYDDTLPQLYEGQVVLSVPAFDAGHNDSTGCGG